MKSLVVAAAVCLLAGCASTPPRSAGAVQPPTEAPTRPSVVADVPVVTPLARNNRLTPLDSVPRAIPEPRIRVGLLSDQTSVTFPRTPDGYIIVSSTGAARIRRGFTDAAPVGEAPVRYAVQVAAISDRESAAAFADKLARETSQRVDSVFDPGTSNGGLYKILAGDFAAADAARPFREQLLGRGYAKDMLIVRRPTDQQFAKQHQLTDDEGEIYTLDGESILVLSSSGDTISIGGKPYRTAARIFINPRGMLNEINELAFEDYLRGVVPAEMGSKIYDELEALKAQAIAARTYAYRNLGQFASEGYDICPGPACQAYNGFSGEEGLTDRAVRETAGQILTYGGKPIDALYTATCGGETSDVGTMFPGRNEPYLKRVRCVELDMTSIEGRADSGILTESQVNARTFASLAGLSDSGTSWSARDVEEAVTATMRLLGIDPVVGLNHQPPVAKVIVREAHPASSRRGDVLRYLGSAFALDADARVLTLPEDRKYFFPQSGDAEPTAYATAAFLIKFGLMPTQEIDRLDLNAAMPREELYALLGAWLHKHQAMDEVTGKIVSISARNVILKADGKNTTYTLPAGIPIFRKLGDRFQEYRDVPVMAGDRAYIQRNTRGVPVSMIVNANFDGASFDRTSSFADWTRSYRADELVTSINKRNPIKLLLGLRPLVIDASQRIAELEVTAEGGRTFVLKGLPVRWSLNVPDNLFVIEKTTDSDGVDRYTFFGKGWGHGVGFCQVGAYGMAFRGWTAQQILTHYYTGVEISQMK